MRQAHFRMRDMRTIVIIDEAAKRCEYECLYAAV